MSPLLNEILVEYGNNPFQAMWFLFGHGLGFLILIPAMMYYGFQGWKQYIWERTKQRRPHMMLSIQVPQLNEQSMQAVEQIFVHIYGGAWDTPTNIVEKYWDGFFLENFAFEIVSDGGYITFYVRTPTYFRDLVEAAFYAQYPDAILTEVDDYVTNYNVDMIMSKKIRVWGSEFRLERDDTMPIKSWPLWEHGLMGVQVDPLASILEVMSRLQPGERWWFQIIAQPADLLAFKLRSQAVIRKVVGDAPLASNDWIDKLIKIPIGLLGFLHDLLVPGEFGENAQDSSPLAQKRIFLTTPEREFVEEVDRKMSRWVFKTKIRFMYFANPDLYDEKKGRRALLGAISQYRFINAFLEGTITRVERSKLRWRYLFPDLRLRWRARRMFWAYRSRDMQRGEHDGFMMSTPELASIFHFPLIQVRAPYVTRATTRGVEPPTQLRFNDPTQSTARLAGTVKMAEGEVDGATIPLANIVPEQASFTDVAQQAMKPMTALGMMGQDDQPLNQRGQSSSQSSHQASFRPRLATDTQPDTLNQVVPNQAVSRPGVASPNATQSDETPQPPSNLPFV